MSMFNFGKISGIISKIMDSDYIDIKRVIGGSFEEIYSNIPCHIAFQNIDNPDPKSIDIKPIIQNLNIHMGTWVDIQNNDYIVAKKMSSSGEILAIYSGNCGNPIVSQSRKKVLINMSGTEPLPPTPVPPQNPSYIIINYLYNNEKIKDTTSKEVEAGQSITIYAPKIEGYVAVNSFLDEVTQNDIKVTIPKVDEYGNIIDFIYDINSVPTSFRFLVNGIYTKDDGSLANGYHLYKSTFIDTVDKVENTYTITSDNVKSIHADNGKVLSIQVGVKLALMPMKIFVQVKEILAVENNKITFVADEFVPTEDELNAYITEWYENGI